MVIFTISPQRSNGFNLSIYFGCFFLLLLCHAQLNASVLKGGVENNPRSLEQKDTIKDSPNFIIIFCDNLGYGDIEPFGSKVIRTPELNRMAKEGRKFTHFLVTAGVCTPSRASIMTGCYSQRVGMHVNPRDGLVLRPISPYGLNPEEITIAEVLKEVGYKTGLIGKWHLGDQAEFLPTNQGFDYFYGIPYSDDMTQEMGIRLGKRLDGAHWPPLPVMDNLKVVQAGVDRNLLTKDYTEKALDFIAENQDEPFFLYLPHAMPGSTTKPFASEAFRGKSKGGPWGDSVEELDWSVGQIMNKLEELGIEKNTVVVFTSDNGGLSTLSKDRNQKAPTSVLPLRAGKGWLYEGGIRIPLLIKPSNYSGKARISTEPVIGHDFYPTFLSLAGITPNMSDLDGLDLSPLLYENKPLGRKELFWHYPHYHGSAWTPGAALLQGDWKLIEFHETGLTELYNLSKDISETRDLSLEYPEKAVKLQNRLHELQKSMNANTATLNPDFMLTPKN